MFSLAAAATQMLTELLPGWCQRDWLLLLLLLLPRGAPLHQALRTGTEVLAPCGDTVRFRQIRGSGLHHGVDESHGGLCWLPDSRAVWVNVSCPLLLFLVSSF